MRSHLPLYKPFFSPVLAVALAMMATPALAQAAAPGTLQPRVSAPSDAPTYALVHVNAQSGSDTSGDGSQLRPYQTITHALGVATANSIVLLAPGEYSEASGERFPIQLRSGVTVQGSPNSALGQTVIRGSGLFASATGGMVQATLVGADGAGLGHVTVTNTSTAGYGLVIESGRPAIRQNQFVGSGYGGVYVTGNSAPVLEGNQFSRNGVVGLVLDGQTAAEVRGNRFEQTGIGIRVAPGAQPQIINNTIVQNQEGLLLDGSANPLLQDNVIAQNRRNGVVEFQVALKAEEPALATATAPILPAQPLMTMAPPASLGGATEPASAPTVATAPIAVAPPAVTPLPRVATPAVVTPDRVAPDVAPPQIAAVSEEPSFGESIAGEFAPEMAAASEAPVPTMAAPAETPRQVTVLPTVPPANSLPLALPSVQSTPLTVTPATVAEPATESSIAEDSPADGSSAALPTIAVPAAPSVTPVVAVSTIPSSSTPTATATLDQPSDTVLAARESLRRWRQSQSSSGAAPTAETPAAPTTANPAEAIPIAVIPPPANTVARASEATAPMARPAATSVRPVVAVQPSPAAPSASPLVPNPNVLPVPSRTIPIGSGGSAIPNLAPPSTTIAFNGDTSVPPSYGGLLGLVYKVVVPAADSATQAQVRAFVADAFRVNLGGQTMMQVGAYADEATAEARANELIAQGFEARVEYRP